MAKKLLIIGLTLVVGLGMLVGCRADVDGRYKGFSAGFNYEGGKIDIIMCAARSDKTEFDVNDVTLDFYLGWYEYSQMLGDIDPDNHVSVFAALYFSNDFLWGGTVDDYRNVEDSYFIREIFVEEFISEAFTVSMTKKSGKSFSHKEILTVPKELFKAEKGLVHFGIVELTFSDNNNTFFATTKGQVQFWYEYINGKTIRLSK